MVSRSWVMIALLGACGGPNGGDDTGDTNDTADTSDTDTGSSGLASGVVYVLGENVQTDLLADAATLWAAPVDADGAADIDATVRLFEGEIKGFGSYSEGPDEPIASADGAWIAFADAEDWQWHIVSSGGALAPFEVVGAAMRSFSPTGSRYVGGDSTGAVLVDPATGTTLASVTGDTQDHVAPIRWAANGSAAVVPLDVGVHVLAADGTTANLGASDGGAYLSSDGSRAMWATGGRVHLADADGTNPADVADVTFLYANDVHEDGALVCDAGTCRLLDFAGNLTSLSTSILPREGHQTTWAPDGSRVFAISTLDGEPYYVLQAIDTTDGTVTPIGNYAQIARVSPDGAWVLVGDADQGWFAVPGDGGEPVALGVTGGWFDVALWESDALIWVHQPYSGAESSGLTSLVDGSARGSWRDAAESAGQLAWHLANGWVATPAREDSWGVVHFELVDADSVSGGYHNGSVDRPLVKCARWPGSTLRCVYTDHGAMWAVIFER